MPYSIHQLFAGLKAACIYLLAGKLYKSSTKQHSLLERNISPTYVLHHPVFRSVWRFHNVTLFTLLLNTSFTGNFLYLVLRRDRFRPRSCFVYCVFLALVSELLVCCIAIITHNEMILLFKKYVLYKI